MSDTFYIRLPVNIHGYSKEPGDSLIHRLEKEILSNGCFITDYFTFAPNEVSLTMEGEQSSVLKTVQAFRGLGILFTENSEFEIMELQRKKGDITLILHLVTGRKKDIGNILDERFDNQ